MNPAASFAYLAPSILFIVGIKMLSSPKSARRGNLVAAAGMLIALIAVFPGLEGPAGAGSTVPSTNWLLISIAMAVGLILGACGAYSVKMTAMPQMVALFNGLGGG